MKTPVNLIRAVERLEPRAILLIDTNTLMDYPLFETYEIAAPGRFLLVIPRIAYNELMNIKRGGRDENTKQRASRALGVADDAFGRGDAEEGIELSNGCWVTTTKTPSPPERTEMSVEDEQDRKNLGRVDGALLRLLDTSKEDIPDTPMLLITKDKDLTRVARMQGVVALPLSSMRSSEELERVFANRQSAEVSVSLPEGAYLSRSERSVTVALTLEKLTNDGDYSVAEGTGAITDDRRYPLRWTYVYRNLPDTGELQSLVNTVGAETNMPLENFDFFGEEERLTEDVKGFARSMLEGAAWTDLDSSINAALFWRDILDGGIEWDHFWHRGLYSLLSPQIRLRLAFMYMEATLWGYGQIILSDEMKALSDEEEEEDELHRLCQEYIKCCKEVISSLPTSLPSAHETEDTFHRAMANMMAKDDTRYANRYADFIERYAGGVREERAWNETDHLSIGGAFLKAFTAYGALADYLGHTAGSLDSGLEWLLNVASDSWTVGQTREGILTHSPFASPQNDEA